MMKAALPPLGAGGLAQLRAQLRGGGGLVLGLEVLAPARRAAAAGGGRPPQPGAPHDEQVSNVQYSIVLYRRV